MSTHAQTYREQSPGMSDDARGAAIKRRRLDLEIDSLHQFHEATGLDRRTLARAEEGQASSKTLDWIEAWLTREEAVRDGAGAGEAATAGEPIKVTLHDVYGVGEMIVEGPHDADELADAVSKILDRLQARGRQ